MRGPGTTDPIKLEVIRNALEDVVADKISPERARTIYGVAVDPARRRVDLAATVKLRQELRKAALSP